MEIIPPVGDMRYESFLDKSKHDIASSSGLEREEKSNSEASIASDMLATMTHIAHAELPWLPLPKFGTQEESDKIVQAGRQLPVVIPLSAAMAVIALHLQLRYGGRVADW
ncbi:uncharacterized protein Pyn_15429 [Prunus yedoensis var. nudiflora]|uniref:Uncharacterized protein n=1 Tax=Prunus yedoensis var. nudiflora TaxID=2094558 RepID=A0A314YQS8_PRUYE|nr:uncharacterized protein Pyn_15429 [Prunus yedoensis var. nudiflora]